MSPLRTVSTTLSSIMIEILKYNLILKNYHVITSNWQFIGHNVLFSPLRWRFQYLVISNVSSEIKQCLRAVLFSHYGCTQKAMSKMNISRLLLSIGQLYFKVLEIGIHFFFIEIYSFFKSQNSYFAPEPIIYHLIIRSKKQKQIFLKEYLHQKLSTKIVWTNEIAFSVSNDKKKSNFM